MDIYLHGIETIESNSGPRVVETIDTGIIGLIFTAPDADLVLWPLNKCVAVHGYAAFPGGLGTAGTGADAFDAIYDQASRASATVVAVRVEEGDDVAETMANVLGSSLTKTGVHALRDAQSELGLKPKLLIAPGFTSMLPTDGVASIALSEGGSGYTDVPTVTLTGGGGTGASARAVIDSDAGEVTEVIIENPGMGYTTAPTIAFSGGGGVGAAAAATLGTVANPVAVELVSLANRLRACAIVDGPNTTSAAAVLYRADFATDRLLIVDPFVKVAKGTQIVAQPASSRVAGLQARVDYDEGFWYSPSNHVLEGIVGTARVVEHSLNDPAAESQYLNRNAVATVVRSPSGGFKLWGSRVPSGDSLKLFWSVRRSHDAIIESIELAHEPFIDKPFNIQFLLDIAETVNAALRRWKALGATLGGRVWLDRGLNTAETWASGHIYVSYDAEAPAPMEHITFVFNRNTGYYEELADDALREIARLSGRTI
jgi:phage tail sheath protein FI